MKSKQTDDDGRLRELLRRGDPAGDGEGLDPGAVARMRREILSAAADGGRFRSIGDWRLALGVGVVAVLAIAMIWLPRDERPISRSTESTSGANDEPRVETAAPRRAEASGAPPAESTEEPTPETVAVSAPSAAAATVPEPVLAPSRELVLARSETEPRPAPGSGEEKGQAMTIRFTTSNGTQIIWTLDPRVEL